MIFYFAFLKLFLFFSHSRFTGRFFHSFQPRPSEFSENICADLPIDQQGIFGSRRWVSTTFFFRRMFNSNIKRKKQCNQTQFKTQQYSKKTSSTLILSFYLFEVLHFYKPNWMPLWYSCVPNKSAALNKSV